MGITVAYSSRIPEGLDFLAFRAFIRDSARDLLWRVEPLEKTFPKVSFRGQVYEMAKLQGFVLSPHFACEPLPFVWIEGSSALCDLALKDEATDGLLVLEEEVYAKTQFAGPETHLEVIDFLLELKAQFLPDLKIEDESDYLTHRNLEALHQSFAAGFRAIVELLPKDGHVQPGFAFAGLFELREPKTAAGLTPYESLPEEHRGLIEDLGLSLRAEYGGFGLNLKPDRSGLEDLDLLMGELDELEFARRGDRKAADRIVHQLGAGFGQMLIQELGGRWVQDEDAGLVIEDLGRVGFWINPFQVAAERITFGPSHGFELHFLCYETLIQHLRATGRAR